MSENRNFKEYGIVHIDGAFLYKVSKEREAPRKTVGGKIAGPEALRILLTTAEYGPDAKKAMRFHTKEEAKEYMMKRKEVLRYCTVQRCFRRHLETED